MFFVRRLVTVALFIHSTKTFQISTKKTFTKTSFFKEFPKQKFYLQILDEIFLWKNQNRNIKMKLANLWNFFNFLSVKLKQINI